MPHLYVNQLHFARHELQRCLEGVTDEEAVKRVLPMNCISWVIGHLALQENYYWVFLGQGETIHPELQSLVGYGSPASTPPLSEMWAAWHDITRKADSFLETLSGERLLEHLLREGQPVRENTGSMLQRNIYHYWFHIGEAHAMRQMLGHKDLPDFVGDMTEFYYY